MKAKSIIAFGFSLIATIVPTFADSGIGWVTYPGGKGPGAGKHVVLLAGDEEYRSEEALPMLGKILSLHHGFKCTVLFSVDAEGFISPNQVDSLGKPETLDSADLVITSLRQRNWPDATMKHFVDAMERGVPVLGLRTSTHPFKFPETSTYSAYNKFGENVFGEEWVSHWGNHKVEATRGVNEPSAAKNPILNGVADVFGDSDVYEVYPPADSTILMRGQVLKNMDPKGEPATHQKERMSDKQSQEINNPMMPIAWTREIKTEKGNAQKVFCTTMGAATDLANEDLRRLVVNGVYWGLGLEVPAKADVTIVGEFVPSKYQFDGGKKGVKASDHELEGKGHVR